MTGFWAIQKDLYRQGGRVAHYVRQMPQDRMTWKSLCGWMEESDYRIHTAADMPHCQQCEKLWNWRAKLIDER